MITLIGRPISKKNSKQIIRVGNRHIPISSKAFQQYEKDSLWQLKGSPIYKGKVIISIFFQMKGKMDSDLDNMATSILDVLQKSGIIENDKNVIGLNLTKLGGYEDWLTCIDIKEV